MKPRKFRTSAADAGQPLGIWLAARLADPEAAALVVRGAVHVDGRRVRDPAAPVAAAQTIVVHQAPTAAAPVAELRVVHAGRDAIVVDKPAGVATQATRGSAEGSLEELVRAQFSAARALHRLDRDASGLVLFARD